MQSTKSPKKAAVRRPEVRSLKIQPKFRTNTYNIKDVPEIRMSGNWLEKLGFLHGKRGNYLVEVYAAVKNRYD